eukprot:Phypoly_transcript_18033.p1 GENE.Phypoly_transcript_18033~~Phypoly_transcript_18033.p1  ORF type:complete len:141 (+),score=1.41 Phypoly_transcript_18033:262-684(+)
MIKCTNYNCNIEKWIEVTPNSRFTERCQCGRMMEIDIGYLSKWRINDPGHYCHEKNCSVHRNDYCESGSENVRLRITIDFEYKGVEITGYKPKNEVYLMSDPESDMIGWGKYFKQTKYSEKSSITYEITPEKPNFSFYND